MKTALTVLAMALGLAAFATAAEAPAAATDGFKVESVAVFKNGYGFFRAKADAEVKGGEATFTDVPAAALGTWWFETRVEGVSIERAVAGRRTVETPRAARDVFELLAANPGKRAVVETSHGKYEGTLLPMAPSPRAPEAVDLQYASSARPSFGGSAMGAMPGIMLRTDAGIVMLRGDDIQAVTVDGARPDVADSREETFVTLHLEGAADGALPVGCQFLQKGVRWIPTYQVDILDVKTAAARLRLQAEVINDIRDLDGSSLQLVVGIPNFMYGELLSPLAYVSEMPRLSVFFQAPRPNERGGGPDYFSNVMASQMARPYERQGEGEPSWTGTPVPAEFNAEGVASTGVSDLFYYTVDGVTLKRGERATLPVLDARVPCRDVYKWEVAGGVSETPEQEYNRRANGQPPAPQKQEGADHYLRIVNETGKPLTSGPALLTAPEGVLAQSVIAYTPAGATVDVRVTGAPDIAVRRDDVETDRRYNVLVLYNTSYTLVSAKSSLTVRNFKKEPVHMVVWRAFDGVVEEAPDGAKVTKTAPDLHGVNPHSRVEWEFDLEPGKEWNAGYTYSTYLTKP